jgi:hypothetical protein
MYNNQINCFREKSTVPKYLLQGAIFPAKRQGVSGSKECCIKTFEGQEVLVQHQGFTQFDLAVSLAYKKIINQHQGFYNVNFSIVDFAKALNRKDGGKTRDLILAAFDRSNKFHLCLEFQHGLFEGYRLNSFEETQKGKFKVSFNMDYLSMVYDDYDTCDIDIDIDMFLSLKIGLQSWLYGFICSVPGMTNISIDALHELSGSNYKNQSDFKKAVKEALYSLCNKRIIDWRHGVSRDGLVFWKFINPFVNKHE